MKLPTVKKFLCCFELETGGLIVGYIAAIGGVLAILGMIGLIILGIVALTNSDQLTNLDGSTTNVTDENVKLAAISNLVKRRIEKNSC